MLKKILPIFLLLLFLTAFALTGLHLWRERQWERELTIAAEHEENLRKNVLEETPPEKSFLVEEERKETGETFTQLYTGVTSPLITADAACELFCRQLENAMGGAAETFLYDHFAALFVDLMGALETRYENAEGEEKLFVRDALYFAAVCTKILLSDARLPLCVQTEAEEEAKLIEEAKYVGLRGENVVDYTVYALPENTDKGPEWKGQRRLEIFLERNHFSLTRPEVLKVLWILADSLFRCEIGQRAYHEIRSFQKAHAGGGDVLCLFDLFSAQTNALALSASKLQNYEGELPEPTDTLYKELKKRALTSFDAPPWKDPVHVEEASPKIWFLPPSYALVPRVFRELHRWAIRPSVAHILYALGEKESLPAGEASLLDSLREAGLEKLSLAERAAAAGGRLKNPVDGEREAIFTRASLIAGRRAGKVGREVEWPLLKDALVEPEANYFEELANLTREINRLFSELDLFRVLSSYGETALTPDRLLETEQLFKDLATLANYRGEGDDDIEFSKERRILVARRFLSLLKAQEASGVLKERSVPLGLEYNFQKRSLACLPEVRKVEVKTPAGLGYEGVRYRFGEKVLDLEKE